MSQQRGSVAITSIDNEPARAEAAEYLAQAGIVPRSRRSALRTLPFTVAADVSREEGEEIVAFFRELLVTAQFVPAAIADGPPLPEPCCGQGLDAPPGGHEGMTLPRSAPLPCE